MTSVVLLLVTPVGRYDGVPARRPASRGLGSGVSPVGVTPRPAPLDGSGVASHRPRSPSVLRSRTDGDDVAPLVRQSLAAHPTGRNGLSEGAGARVAAGVDRPHGAEVGRTGGSAPSCVGDGGREVRS